ncbi:MAG: NTP transferase domain-containing protein [Dehalococcoidia bacterium]|jgi:choline kinase|nr:NTP transferase domain-containing protein [Dehalococcoidia bacterium]
MIAVVLAAGRGARLGSDRPKALLEFGGRTLLDRHFEHLQRLGVEPLVVTGFRADLIDAPWTVANPQYERGSVISLRVALDALNAADGADAARGSNEDLLLMDADVLYDGSILADVAVLERGFALDARTEPGDEEMMLGVRDGRVRALRRGRLGEFEGFELTGESVGFTKVDAASVPALRTAVEETDPEGDHEQALDRFVARHGADYVLVGERPWIEIDFAEDVERAEREILPRLDAAGS